MHLIITYKDIAHAIKVLNKIKNISLDQFELGKVITKKHELIIPLNKKKYGFVSMRSTIWEAEHNDRQKLTRVKYMSAFIRSYESH